MNKIINKPCPQWSLDSNMDNSQYISIDKTYGISDSYRWYGEK